MHAPSHSPARSVETEAERMASFRRAIDAVHEEVKADMGPADAEYIQAVTSISRALEILGRSLIHFSLEPVSFSAGVAALSAHKALELMEIGHMALHGAYENLEGAPETVKDASKFRWKAPIDEPSWHRAHNVLHHQYTNIAGKDPDLDFGGLRLSDRIPHRFLNVLQPVSNLVSWASFADAINLHVTGMLDVYFGRGEPAMADTSTKEGRKAARRRFLRKAAPYYAREYLLFPALAGPFFLKTLVGNAMSEFFRDAYAGAVIYCGHVGAEDYEPGTRAKGRASFYAMQVEAAHDIELPLVFSILAGGLDLQIEHHLFPRLPPNRLRQIAPKVRAICEAHGVRYKSDPMPDRVKDVLRTLKGLRRGQSPSKKTRPDAAMNE
jgi:NADPH-dependent stearoyl-CoA 9-desaturase